MRAPIFAVVSALALSLLTTVVPAEAFDLTGHWVGKYTCKFFSAPTTRDGKLVNKYTTTSDPSTLDISQNGATIGAVIDLGNGTLRHNAFAMPSVKSADVGEVSLVRCSTAKTPGSAGAASEMLRASVKTKSGVTKATFKGVSTYADNFPEVATCKYSYTRVDTADPGISVCP